MAERTQHDVLARIALVPRTMEARGLDASPGVRNTNWPRWETLQVRRFWTPSCETRLATCWWATAGKGICMERGLEPVSTYAALTRQYRAPCLRGPFNMPARQAAGFSDAELAALQAQGRTPKPEWKAGVQACVIKALAANAYLNY